MTREEAITILKEGKLFRMWDTQKQDEEALRMAIEALQEPKTIIGIDIPYGSDKGIAAIFKGKDDKLILEEVKEIMAAVRCKDCRHWNSETKGCERSPSVEAWYETDFCNYGERGDTE